MALALSTNSAFATCGNVQIAEWNWLSGELMANVDKIILESGWGCNVQMVPGGNIDTFSSMRSRGTPHVASEFWIKAVREPLLKEVDAGSLHIINDGPITDLAEGWWIPSFTAKSNPELKTVEDVLARPDLFPHPEDASKGGFVTCPPSWDCRLTNMNLFRAFDMKKKGWKMVDPGSQVGLDSSITKAVDRGRNWFGYYWSPTAMVDKTDLVLLPFEAPFAGAENWDDCIVKPAQECASPQPSAWTKYEVYTVVTDAFKNSVSPEVMEYFGKRVFPGPVMNTMLTYIIDNQSEGVDAANKFLLTSDVWESWVSADVAAKVKASLK